MSSPGALAIQRSNVSAVSTGASWRVGATRRQSTNISSMSRDVAVEIRRPLSLNARGKSSGSENARMVAKCATPGVVPRPDVRRSIARLPARTVSKIGVGATHVEKRGHHPSDKLVGDPGTAHRRKHLEIARIQRPLLDAVQIRAPLGAHRTAHYAAVDLGHTHTPLTSLELIELKEIGLPRDAEVMSPSIGQAAAIALSAASSSRTASRTRTPVPKMVVAVIGGSQYDSKRTDAAPRCDLAASSFRHALGLR